MRDLFLWTRSYSQVPCRLPYFISTLGTHAYTTWTVLTLFSLLKPGILPWFSHRWKHFGSLRFLQLDMSFEAVENILLKCYSGGVFSALMENIITSRRREGGNITYLFSVKTWGHRYEWPWGRVSCQFALNVHPRTYSWYSVSSSRALSSTSSANLSATIWKQELSFFEQYRSYRIAVFCSDTDIKLSAHHHPVLLIVWKEVKGKSEKCSDFARKCFKILVTWDR